MTSDELTIPGVILGRLARQRDPRGSFAEAWRASGVGSNPPFEGLQANLSSSGTGVLRGLHLHRRQSDLWIVLSGVAFIALVDVRPMIHDRDAPPVTHVRTLRADETVVIPPLVAHGFLAVDALELMYVVTNEYDGTDELGFAWNDRLVNVEWPRVATSDGRPVLSERDQANPPLVDLIDRLRA